MGNRRSRAAVAAAVVLAGAAGLYAAADSSGEGSSSASRPEVTTTTAPTLEPDGPALSEGAAAQFADTPLCPEPIPPAPTVPAGHELVSALVNDGGCITGHLEAVPGTEAAERVQALRDDPQTIAATIERPPQDIATTAGPAAPGPAATSDPRRGDQWALDKLGIDTVWARTRGQGATVGVLELAYDTDHEDLQVGNGFVRSTGTGGADHGTHVTGTITADANDVGIIGVAPDAELVFVARAAPDLDSQLTAALAVRRAVDEGADVLNLSFFVGTIGQLNRPDAHMIEVAMRYAAAHDVLVVMANGNCANATTPTLRCPEGANTLTFPQVLATVDGDWNDALITVGATDRDGHVADFSTRLIPPTVSAPGVEVLSTLPGSSYGTMSGTSMAAPHVTGVAALLRASHPSLTAPDIARILTRTAKPAGKAAGAGTIDPAAALALADQLAPGDLPRAVTREQLLNAQVPSLCGKPAGRLVDGQLPGIPENEGFLALDWADTRDDTRLAIGDLTGDGVDDAVALMSCSAGGVGFPSLVEVFTAGPATTGPTHLTSITLSDIVPDAVARLVALSVTITDGTLEVRWVTGRDGDPACCPSLPAIAHIRVTAGGAVTVDDSATLDETAAIGELIAAIDAQDATRAAAYADPAVVDELLTFATGPGQFDVDVPCDGELTTYPYNRGISGSRYCGVNVGGIVGIIAFTDRGFGDWAVSGLAIGD